MDNRQKFQIESYLYSLIFFWKHLNIICVFKRSLQLLQLYCFISAAVEGTLIIICSLWWLPGIFVQDMQ